MALSANLIAVQLKNRFRPICHLRQATDFYVAADNDINYYQISKVLTAVILIDFSQKHGNFRKKQPFSKKTKKISTFFAT
ncbi:MULTISPECIES: hypothetical protein [Levilactobacillus]|uniref:hypothetical protein n=1 Tax=Levilactobacillus TaxID=2767886 RepID=UPI003757C9B2